MNQGTICEQELRIGGQRVCIRRVPDGPPVVSDPLEILDRLGMTPDPWQVEYLTTDASVQILFSCRQAGKTDFTALEAVVRCATQPGIVAPIIATRLDQASELVRRAHGWMRKIESAGFRLSSMLVPQARYSASHATFENGSRLVAYPASETAVRGITTSGKLAVDEAAKVPDDVYAAFMPTRAMTEAPLALLTTPWYKTGRFFEMYTSADQPDVKRVRWRIIAPVAYARRQGLDLTGLESSGLDEPPDVAIQECARMTWPGYLAATEGMTEGEIRREMFGIFSDADMANAVFASAHLRRAMADDVHPLFGSPAPQAHKPGAITDEVEPLVC